MFRQSMRTVARPRNGRWREFILERTEEGFGTGIGPNGARHAGNQTVPRGTPADSSWAYPNAPDPNDAGGGHECAGLSDIMGACCALAV